MSLPAKSAPPALAFASPLLERLSRVHPALPIWVWGPLAVVLIGLGVGRGIAVGPVLAWLASGVLTWTLAEYALHRFVFHWTPSSPRLRALVYPIHGLHHDVQEWDRLVAPPLLAVPLWLAFFGLFVLVLGVPTAFPFSAGFTLGYLAYDYIHLYTHFARPRSRVGRGLRRRHLQHHFACPTRWYGVSSPLWDHVFRTHVPRGVRPARLR